MDPSCQPEGHGDLRPPPFYTRYGIARTGERDAPLALTPYPEVCRHGQLRATVVAAAIDLVGSLFTREVAGTDILLTTDLSLRMPARTCPSKLVAHGRVLRSGRSGVTTAVELREPAGAGEGASARAGGDASESIWAYGETAFARVARAADSNVTAEQLALPKVFASHPLARPLDEEVGVEVRDAARGEVELALRGAVLNPERTLQGALVALLVERAGEVLAESRLGGPQRIVALDLRYLTTARVGPVRSRAAFIGAPEDGWLRVELRDVGRSDRVTATALLAVAPAR
ncbi:MAG: hypothetical protein R3F35_21495 [Myxococcota bacterium]